MRSKIGISVVALIAISICASLAIVGCSKKSPSSSSEVGTSVSKSTTAPKQEKTSNPTSTIEEFAADFVNKAGGQTQSGKIYVKGNKMRQEITMGTQKHVSIIRGDKKVTWLLFPEQKAYMEVEYKEPEPVTASAIEEISKDRANRRLVGKETVNGYLCDKYELIYQDKSIGTQTVWISKKLGVMVKMEQTASGFPMSMEFKNIVVKDVPDSVFEIPAGYSKMSMPGMPTGEGWPAPPR